MRATRSDWLASIAAKFRMNPKARIAGSGSAWSLFVSSCHRLPATCLESNTGLRSAGGLAAGPRTPARLRRSDTRVFTNSDPFMYE